MDDGNALVGEERKMYVLSQLQQKKYEVPLQAEIKLIRKCAITHATIINDPDPAYLDPY